MRPSSSQLGAEARGRPAPRPSPRSARRARGSASRARSARRTARTVSVVTRSSLSSAIWRRPQTIGPRSPARELLGRGRAAPRRSRPAGSRRTSARSAGSARDGERARCGRRTPRARLGADLEPVPALASSARTDVEVAAEDGVVGGDPLDLVEQEPSARPQRREPGGDGRDRLGHVGEQEPAVREIGGGSGSRDVELRELAARAPRLLEEPRGEVEPDRPPRPQRVGEQARRVARPAAEVEREVGVAQPGAGEERAARRLEDLGEDLEPLGGDLRCRGRRSPCVIAPPPRTPAPCRDP